MTDLRQQIARALNSSDLSPSDLWETDVDRLGALAFAHALGGALWALKWANDARAHPRAVALLSRDSVRVCGEPAMRRKLCQVAIDEWLYDICLRCKGRGSVGNRYIGQAVVRQCHACNGSGKRQVSEAWRARELKLERVAYRKWESRYNAVQRRIVDAEAQAWFDIAAQLERRKILNERLAPLAQGPL